MEALEAIHILFVTDPTQHLLTFMPSLTHATLLQTECSYSTAKDTAVDWWHIYIYIFANLSSSLFVLGDPGSLKGAVLKKKERAFLTMSVFEVFVIVLSHCFTKHFVNPLSKMWHLT